MVTLKIKGVEKCEWKEIHSNGEGSSSSKLNFYSFKIIKYIIAETYTGKCVIFRTKILIHTFQGNFIPIGQYAFPFSFIMPMNLPSSFFDSDYN
jgi:hypothetical protein